MFSKFEFIAWLVEKWEVVFSYEEKKPKVAKKDVLDEFDFGPKWNPNFVKRSYERKPFGASRKPTGDRKSFGDRKATWERTSSELSSKRVPAVSKIPKYRSEKFSTPHSERTSSNKKGNSGLGYKAAKRK